MTSYVMSKNKGLVMTSKELEKVVNDVINEDSLAALNKELDYQNKRVIKINKMLGDIKRVIFLINNKAIYTKVIMSKNKVAIDTFKNLKATRDRYIKELEIAKVKIKELNKILRKG